MLCAILSGTNGASCPGKEDEPLKTKMAIVREFLKRADMLLFILCLAASVMGLVAISSATRTMGTSYIYVQSFALVIGVVLYFVFTLIDADIFADQWPLLLVAEFGLIALLLTPLGYKDDTGNRAWLRFLGIGIQPAEVVKVIYIVLTAKHLTYLKEYRNLSSPLSVFQLVGHLLLLFGMYMVISSDLGNALVFFFVFVVMVFAAGIKLYWFLFGGAAMALAIPLAWNYVLSDNQKIRILLPYMQDQIDPSGYGLSWEPTRAQLALSSGRLWGTGLYQGTQTQTAQGGLRSKHADYIFACIGEEMGMIGCIVVILLLTAIIVRCVYVGVRCHSTFGMLVCVGMAAVICFQLFNSVGMCTGLTPVIGLTLPFFSYGGSSLVTMFAAMGIVSGIRYRPKPTQFRAYSSEF